MSIFDDGIIKTSTTAPQASTQTVVVVPANAGELANFKTLRNDNRLDQPAGLKGALPPIEISSDTEDTA